MNKTRTAAYTAAREAHKYIEAVSENCYEILDILSQCMDLLQSEDVRPYELWDHIETMERCVVPEDCQKAYRTVLALFDEYIRQSFNHMKTTRRMVRSAAKRLHDQLYRRRREDFHNRTYPTLPYYKIPYSEAIDALYYCTRLLESEDVHPHTLWYHVRDMIMCPVPSELRQLYRKVVADFDEYVHFFLQRV